MKEVELEYHKDKTPNQDAYLYDFEKGEVSTANLKFDETFGLLPDRTTALGLNIAKLVTTMVVPRDQRKHDAFSSKGIVLVDSSLIPLVGVQQNLTSACMADWKVVAGKNQGLTIEWGKGSSKGPWFITWFKDSMTFAIGWIPIIGPCLSIGWAAAFTAIQDPDGLMDQLRSSIPSIQLTEGLIEEFKNLKTQTNAAVDDNVNLQKVKATESQKIIQESPGPDNTSQQTEEKPDIDDRYTFNRYTVEDVVAEISSSKAISEEEFKSLAAKANIGYSREVSERYLKYLLADQHENGIEVLPDDKYGLVEEYNKKVKAQYAQEK